MSMGCFASTLIESFLIVVKAYWIALMQVQWSHYNLLEVGGGNWMPLPDLTNTPFSSSANPKTRFDSKSCICQQFSKHHSCNRR